MSTGRHARRRAAHQQEEMLTEQEGLAKKAEAEEKERRKDLESQRIATMRTRFGGQAPDVVGGNEAPAKEGQTGVDKSRLPSRVKSQDPMRNTLMSMFLDDQNGQGGAGNS